MNELLTPETAVELLKQVKATVTVPQAYKVLNDIRARFALRPDFVDYGTQNALALTLTRIDHNTRLGKLLDLAQIRVNELEAQEVRV